MKLFVVALFIAAASASPFWPSVVPTTYTYPTYSYMPGVVHPSAVYTHPMVRPVVQPKSEVDQKIHKEYMKKPEEMPVKTYMKPEEMKPEMKMPMDKPEMKPYSLVTPYGYQPVIPMEYNVERPARYHQKNGAIENTVYKRSADAEPFYGYNLAYPTAYYGMYGMPAVTTYGYGLPAMVHNPVVKPVAKVTYTKPVVDTAQKTVANDVITPFGYADKGTYKAETPGTAHYAKRDADADPAVVYPSVYSGVYPYSSVYSPYTAYRTYAATPFTGYYGYGSTIYG